MNGGTYQIRVRESIDPCWSVWLGGITILPEQGTGTVLIGAMPDQAALHGLLGKLRDMQLTILSLQLVASDTQS